MFTQKKFLFPLLLFFSLACAVSNPFSKTVPETEKIPTIDPVSIEIKIAEAAASKVAQTLEAIPTNTITPTPTKTPFPTATEILPTSTPTELPYPQTGSELEKSDDGLTVYTDYAGAYIANPPAEWLALRLGEVEYDEAWDLPETAAPEIQASLQAIKELDAKTHRLFILDIQEGHFSNGFITNIEFVLSPETEASLEEVFAQSVLGLPETLPGVLITAADITKTSSELPIGFIVSERELKADTGQNLRIYQKQVIFMVKNRSLAITLSSTVDFKDQVLPDFETMIDDFKLLD